MNATAPAAVSVSTTTQTDEAHLAAAVAQIDAERLADGRYAYYAEETGEWYVTDAADLADLGEQVLAAEECETVECDAPHHDAYSLWCAGSAAVVVSDLDHDTLDLISATGRSVAYRCQCGTMTGTRCEWTGRRDSLTAVACVPASDRGTAAACGTTLGLEATLHVETGTCLDVVTHEYDEDGEQTDEQDPYTSVLGALDATPGSAAQ